MVNAALSVNNADRQGALERSRAVKGKILVRTWCMAAVLVMGIVGVLSPASAQLPVPVFGQHWDLCDEDLYGGVNSPNPEYGAAVTSIAMVLRYYGLPTQPAELHTWFTRSGTLPNDPSLWS